MKTGLIMRIKSSPELLLCFLLMAALCCKAVIIERTFHSPLEKMNWSEARQYCQENHIDLVTWNAFKKVNFTQWLTKHMGQQVWIGLLRDSENDLVWKWINLKTGQGISGADVTLRLNWADGHQSRHCAFVSANNRMWYSFRCSSHFHFYCSVGNRIYYSKYARNWYNASHYCQYNTSDLATITQTNTDYLVRAGWIGLYREAGETWRWKGDLQSDYRNWAPTQPLHFDCASFDAATRKFHSHFCSTKLQLVCYDDNLVVVNENKTWEEALLHCWRMRTPCSDSSGPCEYRYNLLSLEHSFGFNYVRDRIYKATTDEVWTGLRFLGGKWWWMNRRRLKDNGQLPGCPPLWKHCGTLSKYDTNNWIIRDCSERRNFICYRFKIMLL